MLLPNVVVTGVEVVVTVCNRRTAVPGKPSDAFDVRLEAVLPQSRLRIKRDVVVTRHRCFVHESVTNLTGFQRCYGAAQHVTLGRAFLQGGAVFMSNFDRGEVTPEDFGGIQRWQPGASFGSDGKIPLKASSSSGAAATEDWGSYPRSKGR